MIDAEFRSEERFSKLSLAYEGGEEKQKVNDELIDWLFKVAGQFHRWYHDINENEKLSPINPQLLKIPKI